MPHAIRATFDRRGTALPQQLPDALTREFAEDAAKQQQWASFVANVAVKPGLLAEVVVDLAAFLMPQVVAARAIDT